MPRLLSPGLICPYRIHSARGFRILIARVSAGENESRPDGVVSSLKLVDHKKRHRRHRLRPRAARLSAIRLGQAARLVRRRGNREQKVVDLNAKVPRDERTKKQEGLEVKVDPEADRDPCDGKEKSRDNRQQRTTQA